MTGGVLGAADGPDDSQAERQKIRVNEITGRTRFFIAKANDEIKIVCPSPEVSDY